MRLPNKLKIGAHVFTVEYVKRDRVSQKIFEQDNCGFCDTKHNKIYIDTNQTDDQVEESLIHEILHAINGTMEHTLLHQIAHSLHQVLKDNKMIK